MLFFTRDLFILFIDSYLQFNPNSIQLDVRAYGPFALLRFFLIWGRMPTSPPVSHVSSTFVSFECWVDGDVPRGTKGMASGTLGISCTSQHNGVGEVDCDPRKWAWEVSGPLDVPSHCPRGLCWFSGRAGVRVDRDVSRTVRCYMSGSQFVQAVRVMLSQLRRRVGRI